MDYSNNYYQIPWTFVNFVKVSLLSLTFWGYLNELWVVLYACLYAYVILQEILWFLSKRTFYVITLLQSEQSNESIHIESSHTTYTEHAENKKNNNK